MRKYPTFNSKKESQHNVLIPNGTFSKTTNLQVKFVKKSEPRCIKANKIVEKNRVEK